MSLMLRSMALLLALSFSGCMPSGFGAGAIIRPIRLPRFDGALPAHRDLELQVNGVILRGWLFEPPDRTARGLIVFLHGKDDNRRVGAVVAQHFLPRGYAVLAYDHRAHGHSTGRFCTYGVREKRDLARVLDELGMQPVYVIGHSLGAAVGLQAAAEDPRIRAVVAIASFSELREIVQERAPAFASPADIQATIEEAENQANFRFRDASPLAAAERIKVPVLLIHGTKDAFTSFEHSKRLFQALPTALTKELLLIDGAGHDSVLREQRLWDATVDWMVRQRP